jgi:hypothetical protein
LIININELCPWFPAMPNSVQEQRFVSVKTNGAGKKQH